MGIDQTTPDMIFRLNSRLDDEIYSLRVLAELCVGFGVYDRTHVGVTQQAKRKLREYTNGRMALNKINP